MKNIIILLIDALRIKNLSLFGYNKETDKFLKNLSKDNILFKQHFSTSNATAPAITSILTGKYPQNHGIIHQLPYTKKEEIEKVERASFWLPSFLKEKGYETICIDWVGQWFKKGFDFYGEEDEEHKFSATYFISAKETIDLAISRIKKTQKPFFLLTHFWDTHFPFPNTNYVSIHNENDKIKTLDGIKNESEREYLKKRIDNIPLYTIQDMIDKYDLSIKQIDNEIQRLCYFLKQNNLFENTIIFVLGDHGDSLTEHDIYFNHSGLYDDSIHVPMLVYIHGFEKKEINELTQHTDILPTILDYLNFETNEKYDGSSLIPLIKNNIPIRDKIFAFDGLANDIRAVRTKNRKLIIAKDSFCNLCKSFHHKEFEEYNLDEDKNETNNIYSGASSLADFFDSVI